MNGLELSRLYFREFCSPMLQESFPELLDRLAAGLVGEGSECFGFDDEMSRDHDWGPAVCLWLSRNDHERFGTKLERELDRLPKRVGPYGPRLESCRGSGRTGVCETGRFYFRYIGHDQVPQTNLEWLLIPEQNLATATNGAVFTDPQGEFTAIREGLLAFYPEDVRLKKIAVRCMQIAQSGQYNFPRCVARREHVAARMAEAEFIRSVGSIIFLMNKRYMPFYKWMHRAMEELPLLGREGFVILSRLVDFECGIDDNHKKKAELIEELSSMIIKELVSQHLSYANSDFLLDHGMSVLSIIKDTRISAINIFLD